MAAPLYPLVRQLLVLPATLLSEFILLDVFAGFTATVDEPQLLYSGAWFLFLGILLVVALIEYGGRQLGIGTYLRSMLWKSRRRVYPSSSSRAMRT